MRDKDHWVWVLIELGVTYLFHASWKKREQFLSVLELSPSMTPEELTKLSASTKSIDFATVTGCVKAMNAKPNSVIKSEFVENVSGVIQRMITSQLNLEKMNTTWVNTTKCLSVTNRFVPFQLSSKNSMESVTIEKPLDFESALNCLQTVKINFEPNQNSALQNVVQAFIGKVPTGIQREEQMLLLDQVITGAGKLKKQKGQWFLIPHPRWNGILTSQSKSEIIQSYRSSVKTWRFFTILSMFITGGTIAFLTYRHFKKRQILNRSQVTRNLFPSQNDRRNTNTTPSSNTNTRLQCVICLDAEIIYNMQPCSHLGLCNDCAVQLQQRDPIGPQCPLCRRVITEFQRVYLS